MSKFETESTVMKLIIVTKILYLFMCHLAAIGGADDKSKLFVQKSMFYNKLDRSC